MVGAKVVTGPLVGREVDGEKVWKVGGADGIVSEEFVDETVGIVVGAIGEIVGGIVGETSGTDD